MKKTMLAALIALSSLTSAPANAAVVASTPFLLTVNTVCTGSAARDCRATFGQIAAKRRLDIKFLSCFLTVEPSSPLNLGIAFLGKDNAQLPPHLSFPWIVREAFGQKIGEIYQQTALTVDAGHRPDIQFTLNANGIAASECTISGDLLFLQ